MGDRDRDQDKDKGPGQELTGTMDRVSGACVPGGMCAPRWGSWAGRVCS